MPRRGKKKTAEDLDRAFELAVIVTTFISGTLAQVVGAEQKIDLPPIIANIRRLSIIFIFPSILTILFWITINFMDDETWKMRLKVYSWSSIIFLLILECTELYTICRPPNYPEWLVYPLIIPILFAMAFPLIPFLLIKKILNRYKTVLLDTEFFTEKGMLGTLKRYVPFLLSYIVFWTSFFIATLT